MEGLTKREIIEKAIKHAKKSLSRKITKLEDRLTKRNYSTMKRTHLLEKLEDMRRTEIEFYSLNRDDLYDENK